MSAIADSGALYAIYDARDKHHESVTRAFLNERGDIVVPVAILSEIDYLLREFLGVDAELNFLEDLSSGHYRLEATTSTDLDRIRTLVASYRDLDLGLADATVIATAERLGVNRILTLDERDFRAVRPVNGPFVLLPSDS